VDKVLTCVVTQIALSGSSSTSGATFSWVASNGGHIVSGALTATPLVDAAGTYTLTVTDPVNGCTAQDVAVVTLNGTAPNVAAGVDKVLTCVVTQIALSGSSSTSGATFSWVASNGGNIVSGALTATPLVDAAGTYTLTVTDPVNGCTAQDVAVVTQAGCGKIAPTETTCNDFIAGTAGDITLICYGLDAAGLIKNAAPGVFFYFTQVTPTVSGPLTIQIVQTATPSFAFFGVHQDQVRLYNGICGNLINPASIAIGTDGKVTIGIANATADQTIIVQVKYSANGLAGLSAPAVTNIHYGFATKLNGVPVDSDPDGLNLQKCIGRRGPVVLGADEAEDRGVASELDALELYRPMPNPFAETMRMVFAVGGAEERVDVGVYDLRGRRIRSIVSGVYPVGRHVAIWDGRGDDGVRLMNGVYFIRTVVGGRKSAVRVAIMR